MRLFIVFVMLVTLAGVAAAQTYFEYPLPTRGDIPIPDSDWHEIWPNFCTIHAQNDYEDNGDGVVSMCDYITLNDIRYHIDWAGPTYKLGEPTGAEILAEPSGPLPPSGADPTGQVWHEVYPDFCTDLPVEGWQDNGDMELGVCDLVLIGDVWWHVDEVNLDIIGMPASPVEESTWSRVKAFFGNLF